MCVFFFKQKTAYEMRISDWSSDVCSSDLLQHARLECYRSSGTWADLGQMNRPAILTLNLPEQVRQYFLMTELDTSSASFATVLGPVSVPLASLDGVWTGEFLVLWRSGSMANIGRASCRERVCQYV